MTRLAEFRKAIAAALVGLVGLAAFFVPGVEEAVGPEVIQAVAAILATLAVWRFPNAPWTGGRDAAPPGEPWGEVVTAPPLDRRIAAPPSLRGVPNAATWPRNGD